jgi:hypothetical protein
MLSRRRPAGHGSVQLEMSNVPSLVVMESLSLLAAIFGLGPLRIRRLCGVANLSGELACPPCVLIIHDPLVCFMRPLSAQTRRGL